MGTDAEIATADVDPSGQALGWAKTNLAKGVDPEQLVAGLIKQGWPEFNARQVLDIALTDSAPMPVFTAPSAQAAAKPVINYSAKGDAYARQNRLAGAMLNASNPLRAAHVRRMWIGAVMLTIGLAITIGTMMMASHGESYVLCWGLIIFGFIRLITGFFGWIGSR
jgi:hypothetical protein